jgi:hypothetical protein
LKTKKEEEERRKKNRNKINLLFTWPLDSPLAPGWR